MIDNVKHVFNFFNKKVKNTTVKKLKFIHLIIKVLLEKNKVIHCSKILLAVFNL